MTFAIIADIAATIESPVNQAADESNHHTFNECARSAAGWADGQEQAVHNKAKYGVQCLHIKEVSG